jgi:hypothetical protein
MKVEPIFILSPPRSGSTLLQRLLTLHKEVDSEAEPWILLPLYYAVKKHGVYAEYSHCTSHVAIGEFKKNMTGEGVGYSDSIRAFAFSAYGNAAEAGAKYFIDKTPRYSLISREICEDFDRNKIVFLWRNPLAIVSSIVQTFLGGEWKLFRYDVDIDKGMLNLIDTYSSYKGDVISIRYEDLVKDVEKSVREVGNALGLDYSGLDLEGFNSVNFKGSMGDPTGSKKYKSISDGSLASWKKSINTYVRKKWCKNYLKKIGSDRLALIGYSYDDVLNELEGIDVEFFSIQNIKDFLNVGYGAVYVFLNFKIIKDNFLSLKNNVKIYKAD